MTQENNKEVLRNYYLALIRGDPGLVEGQIAADFTDHHPFNARGDWEGVRAAWRMINQAFPDLQADIEEMVAEGDTVAARLTIFGTHQGEFMGISASGKSIRIPVLDMARFRDGKMTEYWGHPDQVSLLQQLDAMPQTG